MQIIPAIDIIDGKCVRLTQGDYSRMKEYSSNPAEVARQFEDAGITRLHVVDLDGAKAKKIVNYKTLESIASQTRLFIDFGGGVQSDHDIEIAFSSGAKQITGGSIAVKDPDLFISWLEKYGPEKIILGADALDKMIAISGWQENSGKPILEFLEDYLNKGVRYTICTDVARDGLLQGPSVDLYKEILKKFKQVNLIASGGVSTVSDLEELKETGVYGVIIGKAFYEGKISLNDLQKFL